MILRVVAILWALAVGFDVAYVSRYAIQFPDHIATALTYEAAYWAGARSEFPPAYGDAAEAMGQYGDRCGLTTWTHHPPLPTYVTALYIKLGMPSTHAAADFFAAATIVLLLVIGWDSRWSAFSVGLAIVSLCHFAPGFGGWLTLPYEDTWCVPWAFLLAAATTAHRPAWPVMLATAGCAYSCMASMGFLAAIGAGALLAAHGLSRETWKGIGGALVGYALAMMLFLGQVWCHTNWDAEAMWRNWGQAGLVFRINPNLLWNSRVDTALTYNAAYMRETVLNQHGTWSDPLLWYALMGSCLLALPSRKGVCGVALFVFLYGSGSLLYPNLLPPHMHELPRYAFFLPLGGLIILAVANTNREEDPDRFERADEDARTRLLGVAGEVGHPRPQWRDVLQ